MIKQKMVQYLYMYAVLCSGGLSYTLCLLHSAREVDIASGIGGINIISSDGAHGEFAVPRLDTHKPAF